MHLTRSQSAFTLVELSIVLVILGLLVGGVLTDQSLIRAAELRSVSTQFSRYQAAIHTFRDKYFALPGDMTNAQSYWGIQNASPTACASSASTDSKTCNGNGDGRIDHGTSSANESFRFWQHLANAGLIEGNYTGVTGGGNTYTAVAANSPAGRISSTYWFPFSFGQSTGSAQMFDGPNGNTLEFGTLIPAADPFNAALKPEDAYNVDMKVDDGKPGTGKLAVRVNDAVATLANCASTATSSDLTATYRLTSTAPGCALLFRDVF